MSPPWDTIVIGAGVGGLTAAAKLIRAGLRVLVLEKNSHPGGTAYVYQRKGFTFPMGPLGFSNPLVCREILNTIGQGEDFELHRINYRIRAFGLEFPLSLPFSEMTTQLGNHFPADIQGVKQFFEDLERGILFRAGGKTSAQRLAGLQLPQISAEAYLSGLVSDWRLRRILGSQGTREPYSGLPLLAAMWNLMGREGIWYPAGGMKSFCERLTLAVTAPDGSRQRNRSLGKKGGIGEIRLGTEVARIRVEKGKARGVTLEEGTKIDSASVISNADFKTTFLKLMDLEEVPPVWYRAVSNARQTGSVLQVCLGVDSRRVDLSAFREATRLIYRPHQKDPGQQEEVNWDAPEVDLDALASQELEVSLWSGEDEMLSPEGGAVVVVRTEADYSHFAKYRSGMERRTPAYRVYKERLGHRLIREIAHLIPGVEDSIVVMDVATPLTFEDQGGRSGGAVAGWSWDYEDFHDDRPRELILSPIENLYLAGYQAFSALFLGGVPTAMLSGSRAAEAVLQGAGPAKEILIPISSSKQASGRAERSRPS
ncbi:MAG: NAD(P)/FAD-dependent oxidoreductase [Deltaproteobacteria bacterium]|nr:MAG: NAD(P)/FAD-dependent oxidoreductase [Deltaproteobacteria bacterium]